MLFRSLVSRNKEYIIFYRGNDFVTPKVRQVLVEQQQQAISQQDQEELARLKASTSITPISSALKPFEACFRGTATSMREISNEFRRDSGLVLVPECRNQRTLKRRLHSS